MDIKITKAVASRKRKLKKMKNGSTTTRPLKANRSYPRTRQRANPLKPMPIRAVMAFKYLCRRSNQKSISRMPQANRAS